LTKATKGICHGGFSTAMYSKMVAVVKMLTPLSSPPASWKSHGVLVEKNTRDDERDNNYKFEKSFKCRCFQQSQKVGSWYRQLRRLFQNFRTSELQSDDTWPFHSDYSD
jgi:hypothetical protein